MKRLLILLNSLLFLIIISFGIIREEGYRNRKSFYLELVPYDPRSLLQGDYMDLRYKIEREAQKNSNYDVKIFKKKFILVELDKDKVANFIAVKAEKKVGKKRFTIQPKDQRRLELGIDSYFFENGKGYKYEKAKYGEVVLRENGMLRLIGLRDSKFQKIE